MSDCQWIQLNIGLVRRHHPAIVSARKLFAELMPLTLEWRESGQLQCFFFMRKPPDIRLRFFSNMPQAAIAQLNELTNRLYQQDMIDQYFLSQYQPECDRFGGEAAMVSVHAYFDVDTVQWWSLDLLKQQGQQSVSDDVLLTVILQDLFQRNLSITKQLLGKSHSSLHSPPSPPSLGGSDPQSPPNLGDLGGECNDFASFQATSKDILQTWLTLGNRFEIQIQGTELNQTVLSKFSEEIKIQTKEDQILHHYFEANAQLSQNLQRLWQVAPANFKLSDTLANIAQFTLHRHGFDAQRVGTLISQVLN